MAIVIVAIAAQSAPAQSSLKVLNSTAQPSAANAADEDGRMIDMSAHLAAAARSTAPISRAPASDLYNLFVAVNPTATSTSASDAAPDRAAAVLAPRGSEPFALFGCNPSTTTDTHVIGQLAAPPTLVVTAEREQADVYKLDVLTVGPHDKPAGANAEETTLRIVAPPSFSPAPMTTPAPAAVTRQVESENYRFAISSNAPRAFTNVEAQAPLDGTINVPITTVDSDLLAAVGPGAHGGHELRGTNPWESRFAHRSLLVKEDNDRWQDTQAAPAPAEDAVLAEPCIARPTTSPAVPVPSKAPRREYIAFAPPPAHPATEVQFGDALYTGHGRGQAGGACLPDGCPYGPTQSGTRSIWGVDCGACDAPCCATWDHSTCIPWALFGPGEYVGPPRSEHVPAYYLRVNDVLTLTYIASRQKMAEPYRVGVGDRLRIESSSDESLDRVVQVQPDGDVSLPLIGDVPAAGKTIKDLREELVERYRRIEQEPIITVTAVEVNAHLQEIVRAVTSTLRNGGQALDLRVTPEGTIQAPGLGSVYVQGLTLEELRSELEARYAATFGPGLTVSPALTERATSYVFVGGEVTSPGRYTLEGPTTVMQAIAMAGGWNNGGDLHHVVVFRRDENWCLKATRITVRAPYYGKDPCPVNDVWLRDNDLVIVPKSRILCATDVIELYFTRGVYAVFPITFVKDFSSGSSIVPVP